MEALNRHLLEPPAHNSLQKVKGWFVRLTRGLIEDLNLEGSIQRVEWRSQRECFGRLGRLADYTYKSCLQRDCRNQQLPLETCTKKAGPFMTLPSSMYAEYWLLLPFLGGFPNLVNDPYRITCLDLGLLTVMCEGSFHRERDCITCR